MEELAVSEPLTTMPEMPVLGFRNYWYPATAAARVVKKGPVPVRLLGEDLVLFRGEDGKPVALVDRCPHRGTMLSRGRVIFPGTLSCGYHGWTFNGQGECVAAIVEGPESKLPGKVRVKAYPAEERFGIVWIYMGEGAPPPLEDDLPPELLEPDIHPLFAFTNWNCDWRLVSENYPDILHAPFVHRTHIEVLFNKVPAWGRIHVEMLPDGRGIHVRGMGGAMQADYPGVGKFPRRLWWRVLRRRYKRKDWSGASTAGGDVRMPGNIVVKIREPFFGIHMANIGWPVPVEEKRTRHLNLIVTYPKNILQRLALDLWYRIYFRPVHRRFVAQDRRLIEVQNYHNPESLSATDVGLIQWRRLAMSLARKRQSQESLTASPSQH